MKPGCICCAGGVLGSPGQPFPQFGYGAGDALRGLTPELRHKKSRRYVDWVSRVMEQHKGPKMKRFSDRRFTTSIDRWIQIAMTKGVEILELEFFLGDGVIDKGHYAFPYKVLGLEKVPNFFGHNFIGFKSLKVVNFKHVDVAEEILEYLLSNCPGLEQLSIREAANLVSFIYYGGSVSLLLSDVPLLTEVSTEEADWGVDSIRVVFPQLSCCILSRLEILMLDITPVTLDHDDFGPLQNHAFPILANLKQLELIVEADYCLSLHHLSSFMKVSPYLQKLVLKMNFVTWRRPKVKTVAKCPHPYLRVVEIVGYRGRRLAVTQVMHLIKSAVALEKIVIDPVRRWLYPKGMERVLAEVEKEVKARDHAMQHIKHKVPSTIEFACL
ncbi:PREDICTED: uncharacterized protein LOC107880546 [Prunus mume]|uniref:Uncharacterized protein LOC107880546 n=1 Tax=Prunus mume TaxID=102107 RepID=A0ABM1LKI1_PRUMU|nr:PREDICTED: uncharacterized protein LOC107880546 [Prunus mume]